MKVDWSTFWPRIIEATGETLYMVILTLGFGSILDILINIVRPIPFLIFLVALSPLTRIVMGTTIGTSAAVFPMTIAAAFGIARIVETNLISIDPGVIEAAKAMGASPLQIIFTVLIPEALGPLILGLTFVTISLIDFSAIAGTVGGGGLGHIAITYGYQRFDGSVMIVTVVILIALVQLAQWLGNTLAKKILRR